MTKSQIVSHFAEKFEISKKMASAIIEEVAALAVSETKKSWFLYPSWYRETGPGEEESSYGAQSGYW